MQALIETSDELLTESSTPAATSNANKASIETCDPCSQRDACFNNGKCYNFNCELVCECLDGYIGTYCESEAETTTYYSTTTPMEETSLSTTTEQTTTVVIKQQEAYFCSAEIDTEFIGVQSFAASSLPSSELCCDLCANTHFCKCWSYVVSIKYCYLKKSILFKRANNTNVISGILELN